jgi:hypothetical protein
MLFKKLWSLSLLLLSWWWIFIIIIIVIRHQNIVVAITNNKKAIFRKLSFIENLNSIQSCSEKICQQPFIPFSTGPSYPSKSLQTLRDIFFTDCQLKYCKTKLEKLAIPDSEILTKPLVLVIMGSEWQHVNYHVIEFALETKLPTVFLNGSSHALDDTPKSLFLLQHGQLMDGGPFDPIAARKRGTFKQHTFSSSSTAATTTTTTTTIDGNSPTMMMMMMGPPQHPSNWFDEDSSIVDCLKRLHDFVHFDFDDELVYEAMKEKCHLHPSTLKSNNNGGTYSFTDEQQTDDVYQRLPLWDIAKRMKAISEDIILPPNKQNDPEEYAMQVFNKLSSYTTNNVVYWLLISWVPVYEDETEVMIETERNEALLIEILSGMETNKATTALSSSSSPPSNKILSTHSGRTLQITSSHFLALTSCQNDLFQTVMECIFASLPSGFTTHGEQISISSQSIISKLTGIVWGMGFVNDPLYSSEDIKQDHNADPKYQNHGDFPPRREDL